MSIWDRGRKWRRNPPWEISIRKLASRKTGWKCPYCGSEVLIDPISISCEIKYGVAEVCICYEVYCSNIDCPGKYDKIMFVCINPPEGDIAPKSVHNFETKIYWGG